VSLYSKLLLVDVEVGNFSSMVVPAAFFKEIFADKLTPPLPLKSSSNKD